jgi:cytochrome c-type biogenesis protein CcmH
LYSPCCFGGTLDVHDSDLARNLRKEIEFRLAHGEAAEGIQRDFVARYGERVVAARSDVAIRTMSLVLVGLMAAVGAAVGFTVLGWVRRGARGRPDILGEPADRDALDERLDAELAEIE